MHALSPRHCKRSEAIHLSVHEMTMDCFASLAMTTVAGWAKTHLRRAHHLTPRSKGTTHPSRSSHQRPMRGGSKMESTGMARQGRYSRRQRSRSGQTFRDKKDGCIKVVL